MSQPWATNGVFILWRSTCISHRRAPL
jgi:hypothetical protein